MSSSSARSASAGGTLKLDLCEPGTIQKPPAPQVRVTVKVKVGVRVRVTVGVRVRVRVKGER